MQMTEKLSGFFLSFLKSFDLLSKRNKYCFSQNKHLKEHKIRLFLKVTNFKHWILSNFSDKFYSIFQESSCLPLSIKRQQELMGFNQISRLSCCGWHLLQSVLIQVHISADSKAQLASFYHLHQIVEDLRNQVNWNLQEEPHVCLLLTVCSSVTR